MKENIKKLKSNEYLDGWKRCRADFLNFKREAEEKISRAEDRGRAEILGKVLPIIDGLELVLRGLERSLGLEEVQTENFDPGLHEAIGGIGEKIDQVLNKGYKLGGKLIRPARVKLKEDN